MAEIEIENMEGVKKAAMLFITLGQEASSKMMVHLDGVDIRDLSKEIATIKFLEPNLSNEVVKEFYNMWLAKKYILSGGLEYAKELLTKSVGADRSRKMMDRLMLVLEQTSGFEFLTKVDSKQLVKIIQNEHPQTVSLIMAHLDPSHAADSLSALPEDMRAEVAFRMANLQDISPPVVKTVSSVLEDRFQTVSAYGLEVGGVRSVAEIFNRMDRSVTKATLDRLEKDSPDLVAKIRDMMFVFDDIGTLENTSIQEILKRLNKGVLTTALKGADDSLKDRFFANMSKRAVQTFQEEMEYLGPVRLRDVEKAQNEIVQIVRQLDEEDIIAIRGGSEEQFL